jgi:hypothetical protein
MKALRIELGLSAHLLDATGGVFGTEEEQWQCVRVQRAFAGLDESISVDGQLGIRNYDATELSRQSLDSTRIPIAHR